MATISPKLGEFLIKTTKAKDMDDAFHKMFREYLELKVRYLNETIDTFQHKWGMDFSGFKNKLKKDELARDTHSYEVEKDFWEWEEAETLKKHYENLQSEWM